MNHREVIQLWATQQELADYLGITRQAVQKMDVRNRIAPQYWSAICDAKPEVNIRDLANHVRVDMQ